MIISTSSLARKKSSEEDTALFHDLPKKRFLDLGTRIVWPTFMKLSVLTETCSSNAHVHKSHAMFTFKMLFVLYL